MNLLLLVCVDTILVNLDIGNRKVFKEKFTSSCPETSYLAVPKLHPPTASNVFRLGLLWGKEIFCFVHFQLQCHHFARLAVPLFESVK